MDPGQYFLRKNESTKNLKDGSVFRPSGCNKTVRHSEFDHLHNGPGQRPQPETSKNFMTRSTMEVFQKKVPYKEDVYENKEDLIRDDYINRRN